MDKDFIISFAKLMSISGYEYCCEKEVDALVEGIFDESFKDSLGTRFFIKRCGRENAPKILVDAHLDEIGMVVTDIKENGFLTVTNIGGVDTRILQASDVIIYGKEKIFGVVGSTPPHLQNVMFLTIFLLSQDLHCKLQWQKHLYYQALSANLHNTYFLILDLIQD